MEQETNLESKLTSINLEDYNFRHISVVTDEADQWREKLASGAIKPYVFRSEKMNDRIGGVLPGEQIVIAARTGVGKSSYVNWILEGFSDTHLNPGIKPTIFLYWSVEMRSWRQIIRLYSLGSSQYFEQANLEPLTVKDILSYKDPLQQEALNALMEIRKWLDKRPIYFRDQTTSAKKWGDTVRNIQVKNPLFSIMNIWDHTRLVTKENESSEEQKITNLMDEGMRVKNDIECVNIWLSQMNRNIESQAGGKEIGARPPVSSDIFGADAVQQFADLVLAPHRPENYNIGLYLNQYPSKDLFALHVLKQREGWTGMIRLKHRLKYNDFADWEDDGTSED